MRLISTIFAICFLTNIYCQDVTSNKPLTFGLSVSESFTEFDGVTLNPSVILKYSDNNLMFSWKIFQSSKAYYRFFGLSDSRDITDRLGFSIVYKRNLLTIKSKINFDYLIDFSYSNIKGQENTTYNNGTNNPAIFSINQKSLSFSPGYELGFKIIKNLSIVQSFGVGIEMIKTNDKLKLSNRDYTIFDKTDNYSDNFGFALNLKLGIEYIF